MWDKISKDFKIIEKIKDYDDFIYFYVDPGYCITKRDFVQRRMARLNYP
jgi:hypothetical protein